MKGIALWGVVAAVLASACAQMPEVKDMDKAYGAFSERIVERIRLWPGLAPHEESDSPGRYVFDDRVKTWRRRDVSCPELVILRPTGKPRDTIVIVMPGGGYDSQHMGHICRDAKFILDSGRWVAVLHYRIPRREGRNIYDAPREDAARAIRHLRANAAIMGKRYEDYRAEMKRWYNGFRFAKGDPTTVYNPISVALTLKKKEAEGFTATWATTGRPSMLMNYLMREDLLALDYEKVEEVAGAAFDVAELRNLTAIALLYQAGYLTIKAYDADVDDYTLGVPDEEIRRDLSTLVAGVAAEQDVAWAANLGKSLLRFNWPKVFAGIKSLYAHLPYGPKEDDVQEFSYERVLYALLASQGIEVVTEDRQSNGRADVVAKHKKGIYIFELKVDDPVDRAFAQIREKNYAAPYLADPRPVWLVGLSFDSKTRHLVDCAAERFVEE